MNAITAPERIWAKVRGAMQSFPSLGSYVIGSFEARPDERATEYIRSDLVPSWNRDMSAAPAGEAAILATTGGHVGGATAPNPAEPDDAWEWCDTGAPVRHTPIAWMPLPEHPDEDANG
ncbi:hypothetical protein FHS82_001000 [Pseudochelatococcus lubricantis]|uniref:DUF551 domain-containing protein n=1 Tax=Pseudochelatococcus lubricantis TaxID=1538102 RepID=A0ABX0UZ86_9HYPH|nr:hypothetical protein [Pseudochelatococcus lubricantis]